jgi:large subunit ribosomal protein L25
MDEVPTIMAEPREDFGKNCSRRLRRSGRIPAVVYGGGPAIPITVDPKRLSPIVHSEAGHTVILNLEIRGRAPARVMLKDWQVEPIHGQLLHVDLVRIAKDAKLKIKVPIHITGQAKGVKVQGGIFEFVLRELEVECLPEDIPEHVDVDVTELLIGRQLRVSDLPIVPRVKALTDPTRVVAHVVALRAEEEKPAEAVAEAAPAEPEVIRKGKAEEEEEGKAAASEKGEKKAAGEKSEKKEGK